MKYLLFIINVSGVYVFFSFFGEKKDEITIFVKNDTILAKSCSFVCGFLVAEPQTEADS